MRTAVSGVATHLNQLFESGLSRQFRLSQFEVGREGRSESGAAMVARTLVSPFAFAACLLRARPQIVHINTSFEPKGYWRDIVYLGVAKALRRKVVYQVHGGVMPGEFFGRNRVLTALLRRILTSADVVVLLAHSEMTAYREFAPRARLTRIANAVALSEVDLTPGRYLTAGPLEIVYLGRLAATKGIFESIEAMRILRARGVAARLTLAGSGSAAAAACQAIAAAGLADRVRVIPPVFGTAKQRLWQQATVFVFPTYHLEGLPYALLEAMACGVVPVTSAIGAIPDVVQHEVHGLLVPAHAPEAVADALQRLAEERTLLQRLAVAAHSRIAQHYSVARLEAEFAALYAELVR
jgi:glycosyltransferase involved in cell wall biosynthesis